MKKRENLALSQLKEMRMQLIIYNLIIIAALITISIIFGFDYRLYTGLIAGNLLMLLNFIIIGITAGAVAQTRQFRKGQFLANFSYGARYIGIFVILALLLTFGLISPLTAVIPLFYPKLYYTVQAIRGKYDND